MKPSILVIILLLTTTAFAQTGIVKGRVIDAKTFKPLPFATVYMNQTTIGTVTNDQGDFEMNKVPTGPYELVVSYVGYQPYQSRVTVNDSIPFTMSIKMVASTTNLDEVMVRSKKDSQWNTLLEKFRRQFLGVSPYLADCKILNPWVLEFNEDSKGFLTAKASLPIEIENLGLGYNITCTLKEFTAGPNLYKISGTYRFAEAETYDTALSELWHSRREEVYRGSPRHLFKAIVDNRVVEEGFDLYQDISHNPEVVRNGSFLANVNVSLKSLPPHELLEGETAPGQFVVKLPERTEIHYVARISHPKVYRNISHPVSWIEVVGGSLTVNKSGVVMNPTKMVTLGAMGESRIAELLPLDYHLEIATEKKTTPKKSYSSLAALLEKPYLVTDKPYYYPSDAIFVKAYFNYIAPVYRDSLSHVMHVELIDSSKKIVQSKLFPVLGGTSNGDLNLPTAIEPGDYTLRAYTRWMMNFDENLIFTRAIKVLSHDQLGKVNDIASVSKQLQILTEKDEFETREKITLALEATNYYGNVVAAELAVSVTDLEQAAVPLNEKNILTQYPFTKDMLPDTSLGDPKHLIQHGIDFKGQMVQGRKNKAANGLLVIYQENADDVFSISTDATGKFHQQLQLQDSVELLIAAKTLKGHAAKVIVEHVKDPVPEIKLAAPLQVEVYKPSDPSKYHKVDLFSTARMLENVTIEAKRIQGLDASKKFLLTDGHLDGEQLRATNAVDLLTALRGRLPGLHVLYYSNPMTGEVKKYVGFRGTGSQKVLDECLVEIDGMVVTGLGSETVGDRLGMMSVNEIESVDVLRFAPSAAYGARAANGVIVIKTTNGSSNGRKPKPDRSKLQVVNMAGYSTAAEFSSPDYSEHTNGDDLTDFRSTIYWNPFASTDGSAPLLISFYAADVPTRYRIVVEGITADGEAVRGEKIIVVTGKK